jgi:cyclopropane fatty-acyl-phospholipid synthase-like methyltransferase
MTRKRKPISNAQIVDFLSTTTANATFLQKLKIKYRPFVCPFDELLAYATSGDSVYDIGCGSGQFCALVAKFTDVKRIGGIEIDASLVANAKKINSQLSRDKKLSFSIFDGVTIPSDIKKYDLIYMIDVYHHIPKRTRNDFMKQLYKKMKPGAKLMFKDIDGGSPFVACNKVHDLIFAQELSHEIGFKKASHLLESLGFTILEARKKRIFVYPHYFLLVQK